MFDIIVVIVFSYLVSTYFINPFLLKRKIKKIEKDISSWTSNIKDKKHEKVISDLFDIYNRIDFPQNWWLEMHLIVSRILFDYVIACIGTENSKEHLNYVFENDQVDQVLVRMEQNWKNKKRLETVLKNLLDHLNEEDE